MFLWAQNWQIMKNIHADKDEKENEIGKTKYGFERERCKQLLYTKTQAKELGLRGSVGLTLYAALSP